jgi:hypothetical protein
MERMIASARQMTSGPQRSHSLLSSVGEFGLMSVVHIRHVAQTELFEQGDSCSPQELVATALFGRIKDLKQFIVD